MYIILKIIKFSSFFAIKTRINQEKRLLRFENKTNIIQTNKNFPQYYLSPPELSQNVP